MRILPAALLPALLLGACAASSAEQPQDPAPRHLRVATYNIHCGGRGMDGKVDLHRIAKVLAAEKPDVVFLQEVDVNVGRSGNQDTAGVIAKDLGMGCVFGKAIPLGKGEYGVAILSAWPMKKVDQLALTGRKISEARTALFVEATLPADAGHSAKTVLLACTHLDYLKSAETEVAGHAKAIADRIAKDGRFALLGGDLNFEPGTSVMDAFTAKLGHADKVPAAKTCPADKPSEDIDHLFWFPAAAAKATRYEVLPEAVASDHRPVVMELEVKD